MRTKNNNQLVADEALFTDKELTQVGGGNDGFVNVKRKLISSKDLSRGLLNGKASPNNALEIR